MESLYIDYQPHAYPALETAVLGALEDGVDRVVIDLDSLDALDTDGVRGLITLLRRARTAGGQLALRSSKPEVRRTLSVTALDRIFEMVGEAA